MPSGDGQARHSRVSAPVATSVLIVTRSSRQPVPIHHTTPPARRIMSLLCSGGGWMSAGCGPGAAAGPATVDREGAATSTTSAPSTVISGTAIRTAPQLMPRYAFRTSSLVASASALSDSVTLPVSST